jgi:mannose-1-phosphate guanylyltransferase
MSPVYAVIMAGGRGERFWPLSTNECPKPFLPLLGPTSLIEATVERLLPLLPPERLFISIGRAQVDIARKCLPQIREENFIIEPVGRDTSACLGFCALHLHRVDPGAVMLALPADHFVGSKESFRRTMEKGIGSLRGCSGIVFGIRPVRPDPSYGYVLAEKPALPCHAWPVVRFVEKPNEKKAADYLRSGGYFWNSGIFIFEIRALLDLFARHLPETYQKLMVLQPLLEKPDSSAAVSSVFSSMERISIDFGILEKASGLRLVPAEFEWDDIGSWSSLARVLPGDLNNNVIHGSQVSVDSSCCLIYSDSGTVATLGLSGLVIVHARGKVLICPRERAAELKRLVTLLDPQQK